MVTMVEYRSTAPYESLLRTQDVTSNGTGVGDLNNQLALKHFIG